jgi:hypothetical protein
VTRKRNHYATCPECGGVAVCSQCGAKVPASTPFSDWLRGLEYPLDSRVFSNHNLDFIWHNYRENWFITIEEKRYGARCTGAQRDTHGVITQLLEIASGSEVKTMRGLRKADYRGHYVVRFERTSPDDSEWIRVRCNGTERVVGELGLRQLLENGFLQKVTKG